MTNRVSEGNDDNFSRILAERLTAVFEEENPFNEEAMPSTPVRSVQEMSTSVSAAFSGSTISDETIKSEVRRIFEAPGFTAKSLSFMLVTLLSRGVCAARCQKLVGEVTAEYMLDKPEHATSRVLLEIEVDTLKTRFVRIFERTDCLVTLFNTIVELREHGKWGEKELAVFNRSIDQFLMTNHMHRNAEALRNLRGKPILMMYPSHRLPRPEQKSNSGTPMQSESGCIDKMLEELYV